MLRVSSKLRFFRYACSSGFLFLLLIGEHPVTVMARRIKTTISFLIAVEFIILPIAYHRKSCGIATNESG